MTHSSPANHKSSLYDWTRGTISSWMSPEPHKIPPSVTRDSTTVMSSNFSQMVQVIARALSPLPKYQFNPKNDDISKETGILEDLQHLNIKDIITLKDVLDSTITGEEDDDTLLQERLVTLLAKLPPHSREGKQATDAFINTLWDSLEHPPAQIRSKEARYREADGSSNNVDVPAMGAANTRYARTTPAKYFQDPNLPDPGLLFDSLMNRGNGESFREHPNKISSMLFYLATIITHDIFQTDSRDQEINLTSSYLDLSPLYGRNAEEQKAMRTLKDGLLKPDCFSSTNPYGFPPGIGVFLIMFNRFHNYVVTQLASINEGGRFTKPASIDDGKNSDAWKKYDNDLFQTGRLITCGLYVNIILKDYVRTILNLNRTNSTWDLDPRSQEKKNIFNGKPAPEATGNQVSVEFNLVYRWHSALSKRDEKWITDEFRTQLNVTDPAKASFEEVLKALVDFRGRIPDDPLKRNFANLQRGSDGTYSDDDLVEILSSSIEDVSGAFGANQIPSALRVIEILGIKQARAWHVATLNEFRQHFGLKKHATFEAINPDPAVASKLMSLYDSPDSVELYPGLIAEKPKPPMDGSGLCINVTTSRVILSDAVALVRGDRFYTTDYTPSNLTNWGFNEVDVDLKVDQGQVMHKLILRAFPFHFEDNSIQAHFPFVVPSENKAIHDKLGTSGLYSWEKPTRKLDPVVIESHKTATQVLDKKDFYVPWNESISSIVRLPGKTFTKVFRLSGDDDWSRGHVYEYIFQPRGWEAEIEYFLDRTTKSLLKKVGQELSPSPLKAGSTHPEFEVDMVRDIIIPLTTRFIAEFFALPIKTAETSPHGIYDEHELHELLTAMFSAAFFHSDPANAFKLRNQSREFVLGLEKLFRHGAKVDAKNGWIGSITSHIGFVTGRHGRHHTADEQDWPRLPHYGRQLLSRMMQKGKTIEDCVVGTVMPISAAGATIISSLLSQCLDYFLGAGSEHLPRLCRLAHENTTDADNKLLHYMLEGIRLHSTVVLTRTVSPTSAPQKITDDIPSQPNQSGPISANNIPNPGSSRAASTRAYTLTPNQRVIVDMTTASHDSHAFPSPESLRLDRPLSSYLPWGTGPLGEGITRVALLSAFKVLLSLPNLHRAPGPRGEIKSVEYKEWRGQVGRKAGDGGKGLRKYMTLDQSTFVPVPASMRVRWGGTGADGRD
ncbi:linoleate diol synthase precursor [Annulohypoxylon maeteangense]|uniref:linoleate diol synthase precursor n=1 Tax=Annulohypoxylon maeteangense TaxID=1927788 RepID=UPI002007F041|nr:linoleate diol synthase precursor [Annulohypoxylon maeteangense]KAI0883987.1 linoleate diol synthase precursor [Annulohypoxylon maeteangense]